MRRAILLATLLCPLAAAGQASTYPLRAGGYPTGLTVPGAGVASGEEPAAMAVNPAAIGFNEGLTLQYFHERVPHAFLGDGLYVAAGPLALTSEWVSPTGQQSYRKLGLGLGLGGRAGAVGLSFNDWSSAEGGVGQLRTWDLGLTVRPTRHLSVGIAALDLGGRLRDVRLPMRTGAGLATRLLDDSLTLSADWLGDDGGGNGLRSRSWALGLGYETRWGVALHTQVGIPSDRSRPGVAGATVFQLAVALNSRNAGLILGGAGADRHADEGSLWGLRFSTRDYRAGPVLRRPVLVDLHAELEAPRSIFWGTRRDPFGALLTRLRSLSLDPEVTTVVLRITPLSLAPGHADELRAAIAQLRGHKPVVAHIEGAGLREYYLATAATRIEMLPPALLTLTGLASTSLYLRETLAKVGIAFQAVAMGKYKSAPDTLSRDGMSEAEREALTAVLDDVFDRQVKAIAEARRLPEARVRELVDQGLFHASAAREAGLVDALSWSDELERSVGTRDGFSDRRDPPEPRLAQRWGPIPAVAVVRVAGLIVPGKTRGGLLDGRMAGAETVAGLVRRAAEDRGVRAIVLRVDSPGGDALASDVIWRSLTEARRSGKPVVVSMGSVAASGGYWIATGADAIVAEPSTITGSIGVFAQKPDLSGLLGKIGATQVTLKRGARADIESPFRPWTAEEQEAIRREIQVIYDTFVARVAESRKLSREAVEGVAQGRIWTGAQALERKLVDRLGSLSDAVALARDRAGIPRRDDVEIRRLEAPRQFPWDELDMGLSASADPLTRLLSRSPELQAAAGLLEMGTVVALPYGLVAPVAATPSGAGE